MKNFKAEAKQFEESMRSLSEIEDQEGRHEEMDELMCQTLEMLGFHVGVDIFRETDKWYA